MERLKTMQIVANYNNIRRINNKEELCNMQIIVNHFYPSSYVKIIKQQSRLEELSKKQIVTRSSSYKKLSNMQIVAKYYYLSSYKQIKQQKDILLLSFTVCKNKSICRKYQILGKIKQNVGRSKILVWKNSAICRQQRIPGLVELVWQN